MLRATKKKQIFFSSIVRTGSGVLRVARSGSGASACRAPGPLEWARAETGRVDRGVLWRREFPEVARVNKVTPVSLGYPLSVFNKNSTLKERKKWEHLVQIFKV